MEQQMEHEYCTQCHSVLMAIFTSFIPASVPVFSPYSMLHITVPTIRGSIAL
jgi:hypothetical protein